MRFCVAEGWRRIRHPDIFGLFVLVRSRAGGLALVLRNIAIPKFPRGLVLEMCLAVLDFGHLPLDRIVFVVEVTIPRMGMAHDPDTVPGSNR